LSGYLLDTNVISELTKPEPDKTVKRWVADRKEATLFLSAVTFGEIRIGIMKLRPGGRRARLESWLHEELLVRFRNRILPVDFEVADRWGVISALARFAGKPVPVIDGLLAATALQHDLIFVTRNVSDVSVTGVRLINPWA
jgi:predicted nucleic acid-binding protein